MARDSQEAVLKVLRQTREGLSPSELEKRLGDGDVRRAMETLIEEGQLIVDDDLRVKIAE